MNDEIKNDELPSEENAQDTENDEDTRPPVDPKNKLYTFISLLIFAVLYIGWQIIKANVYFSSALYADDFSEEEKAAVISEIPLSQEIGGAELRYARLHQNFDGNSFYAAVFLPDISEYEELSEAVLTFPYGDPEYDSHLTVYPDADIIPDYVYGDSYVSTDDPRVSCMIYGEGDGYVAVFRIADYSGNIKNRVEDWEKFPVR